VPNYDHSNNNENNNSKMSDDNNDKIDHHYSCMAIHLEKTVLTATTVTTA
jgi:hypothetical protein